MTSSGEGPSSCTRRSPAPATAAWGRACPPHTALAVGLKVDLDALPGDLVAKLQGQPGRPERPGDHPGASEAELGRRGDRILRQRRNARLDGHPVRPLPLDRGRLLYAPGIPAGNIGRRLDGWANRDLNVGAIINLSPDLSSRGRPLHERRTGRHRQRRAHHPAELGAREVRRRSCSWTARTHPTLHPSRLRPGGGQPSHLDRLGLRHPLERLRGGPRDARPGDVLRPAPEQPGPIPAWPSRNGFGNVRSATGPRHLEAGGPSLLPAGHPGPDPPAGSFDTAAAARGRRSSAARRIAPGATCRRSSPSRGGTCTPPPRSGSTMFQALALPRPAVPHVAAEGPVDPPEGRLLPRRAVRHPG